MNTIKTARTSVAISNGAGRAKGVGHALAPGRLVVHREGGEVSFRVEVESGPKDGVAKFTIERADIPGLLAAINAAREGA